MSARILIAEDNPTVRTALRNILQAAGPWEITDVANGREAIAKAQELNPQLIILDLVMPVMDGLVAARQISKLLPDTPLLMHTMHWSSQVEVEAQKVGVRKVIPKSDTRLLISTVEQILLASAPSPAVEPAAPTTDIPVPAAAPPSAVLETNGAAASDQSADSSAALPDVSKNSQPN
jgi:CheY-like chemotaxis protein